MKPFKAWTTKIARLHTEKVPHVTAGTVVSEFCDYTSTHGPAHLKRVKNHLGKVLWLLIILTFSGVLAWQLITLLREFVRFDYNVLIEVIFDKQLAFPAVTYCNMNPYRKSKVLEMTATHETMANYYRHLTGNSRRRKRDTAARSSETIDPKVAQVGSPAFLSHFSDINRGDAEHMDHHKQRVRRQAVTEAYNITDVPTGSGTEGTGTEGPGTEGLGTESPGTEGSGTAGLGTEDPGTEGSVTEGSETEGFGTEGPGTENPIMEGSGTESPVKEESGTESPVTEESGTESPVTEGSGTEGSEDEYDYYDFWDDYDTDYDDYLPDYKYEVGLRESINSLPTTDQSKLGHKLSSMLLGCTYAGRPCTVRNFTSSWNYRYGTCYTYTGDTATHGTTGPDKGLSLELYLELNEYIADVSPEAGFKVLVHDRNRVPFPDKDGFTVSAGFSTSVGIRKLEVERLTTPYYGCSPITLSTSQNIYSHQYPNSYNLDVCEISCYQSNLILMCSCADTRFPTDHPTMPANLSSCFEANSSDCALATWDAYVSGKLSCSICEQSCHEAKFYTTLSSAVWPTPNEDMIKQFREDLASRKQPSIDRWLSRAKDLTGLELATDMRNNVAKITVFYEDLNYERVYQTPAYTWISFISNLGGLLGLWVGMSVLSICEWVEFLARLTVVSLRQGRCARQVRVEK